jgi:ComF family protein
MPELMIPVPLHFLRLYSRGFNQALEICRVLTKELNIPYDSTLVVRDTNTAPMAALARERRRENIRGAFRLARPLPSRSVAIVDDVITSGATSDGLAVLLREAGARHIQVWSLTRAE